MTSRTIASWLLCFTLTLGSSALAQATRTWVSGVGDDANPCSRTAPCKTFAGAISKTAAGGEIDALDPGGFGAITITKAVTLDAHATYGGVLVAGTNGIVVTAGATDVVVLRGLNITGLGTGLDGIHFNSGAALHVEDCVINQFSQYGISFAPTAAAQLFVKNTQLSENTKANILVGGVGQASITKSELTNSVGVSGTPGVGLDVAGTAKVSVHDSLFAGNTGVGVHSGAGTQVNLERSVVANNGTGIQGDGLVRISEIMVSDNTTGVAGNVSSFGNNRVSAGNTTNGAPNATIPQQ